MFRRGNIRVQPEQPGELVTARVAAESAAEILEVGALAGGVVPERRHEGRQLPLLGLLADPAQRHGKTRDVKVRRRPLKVELREAEPLTGQEDVARVDRHW